MLRWIDRSKWLGRIVQRLSNFFAKRRGLPIIIGIIFVTIAFMLQLLDVYMSNKTIEVLGVILHHMGVLIALIGLLLVNPLGKV